MKSQLETLFARLAIDGIRPEEVFGRVVGGSPAEQKACLNVLCKIQLQICHPDRYAGQAPAVIEMATAAMKLLTNLQVEAHARIQQGIYGKNDQVDEDLAEILEIIKSPRHEYRIHRHLMSGDSAEIYLASYVRAGHVLRLALKVARDADSNPYIRRAAQAMERVRSQHVPEPVERFDLPDGRTALAMLYVHGLDLVSVREKFSHGLPVEHAAWILARLLSGPGSIHKQGMLHGNITPAHIMIRPVDHNAHLVGFGSAILEPRKETFQSLSDDFSPPEALAKKPPLPNSDLYSLGKCMLYLLGGDLHTNRLPDSVPPEFREFIHSLLPEKPLNRRDDAWKAFHDLKALRQRLGLTSFVALDIM